jgi:hypothetical protein
MKETAMEIQPKKPTAKGPADWFTGNVWIDPITQGHGQDPLSLGSVPATSSASPATNGTGTAPPPTTS